MFKRYWWVLLVMLLIGPLAGLFTGGVLAYIQPKLYAATSTIQIKPSTHQTAEREIATQAELLTSDSLLNEVSERLDLPMAWNLPQHEVTAKLKHSMSVQSIRGTDLLEVTARLHQPEQTKEVVDTLVEAYSERINQGVKNSQEEALAEIRTAIHGQEDSVEEKRKVLATLTRQKTGGGDAEAPMDLLPESQGVRDLALEEARADYETSKQLLEQLKIKSVTLAMEHKTIEALVTVHSSAVTPHAPVSPNIPRNLVLGTLAGLLGGLILALPLMALLNRRASRRTAVTS